MKGFFEDDEIEDKSANCIKCNLFKGCNSPRMKATGKGKKKILVVAEAPGAKEDERGEQLIGQAGQVLRRALKKLGIDLDRDCWKTNVVCCRPPKNKTPTKLQINACHPRLERVLKKKKPHLIILLGGIALESFINTRLAEAAGGINRWRGFIIPDQRYKAWVTSTFHPSYLLRNQGTESEIIEKLFNKDLKNGLKMLKKKVPINPEFKIRIKVPLLLKEPPFVAFDYETTGLKPYTKGHEIVCCAISIKENEAYVFDIRKESSNKWWSLLLKNKRIKKTAHNMKFEHLWSKEILGVTTKGWEWDSMQTAHIIDNRKGITGLKFQAYVNFGIEDYSSHLDKYIKSDDGNGFNKIKEAPIKEVLEYCGMDALIQYKLALKQRKEIRR